MTAIQRRVAAVELFYEPAKVIWRNMRRHRSTWRESNPLKRPLPLVKLFESAQGLLHEQNVKKMEVQLSAFFAEHNVAFLPANHPVNVIKRGITDSQIAKGISLSPNKCSAIVRKVNAATETGAR